MPKFQGLARMESEESNMESHDGGGEMEGKGTVGRDCDGWVSRSDKMH